jgi:hypothetical protein
MEHHCLQWIKAKLVAARLRPGLAMVDIQWSMLERLVKYEIASNAVRSTEGFSFVVAGAKALLEHNVLLNLVPDRFPDGLPRR